MKFKIILYNKKVYKEEEKERGKKLFYLELFKKNIGNVMNKFKGVKEMRVQVLKLIISFKSDKLGGGIEKCLKSSLNKEILIKRKNVIKKSLEFFFGLLKKRKQLVFIDIDIEIKKELEFLEEDNFDNDLDYFFIKEELGLLILGRKKSRIGRFLKIGSYFCKKC